MSKKKAPQSRMVKRKSKSKRKLSRIFKLALVAFLIVLSYGIYLYIKADNVLSDAYEEDDRGKSELRDKIVDPKFDNVSVLIMGIDASNTRENASNARTDTLMLATLNKEEKSVKLLSIPRDSYVYIPEKGYEDKINHAHAYGGTKGTVDTVESLLNIPVDYYVKVNFEAFIDVVDAVDGITVDVPYELYEQDSEDKADAIHLYSGEQQLNGEEALALARTRKLDNDIERGKRQQDIIKAIVNRTISLNSILKYDDIIDAVGGNMTTNMSFKEMKSFISYGTSGTNLDFETLTLEGDDYWVYEPNKKYYWQLDDVALGETRDSLRRHLEIEDGTSSLTKSYNTEETRSDSSDSSY